MSSDAFPRTTAAAVAAAAAAALWMGHSVRLKVCRVCQVQRVLHHDLVSVAVSVAVAGVVSVAVVADVLVVAGAGAGAGAGGAGAGGVAGDGDGVDLVAGVGACVIVVVDGVAACAAAVEGVRNLENEERRLPVMQCRMHFPSLQAWHCPRFRPRQAFSVAIVRETSCGRFPIATKAVAAVAAVAAAVVASVFCVQKHLPSRRCHLWVLVVAIV